MNKRADISGDILFILIFLFIFSIFFFVLAGVSSSINTSFQASDTLNSQTKTISSNINTATPRMLDSMIILITAILWFFSILSAYFIDTNPIFFIIAIILLPVDILVAYYIGNAYQVFTSIGTMTTMSTILPYTTVLLDHLVEFVIAMFISIGIALYSGRQS